MAAYCSSLCQQEAWSEGHRQRYVEDLFALNFQEFDPVLTLKLVQWSFSTCVLPAPCGLVHSVYVIHLEASHTAGQPLLSIPNLPALQGTVSPAGYPLVNQPLQGALLSRAQGVCA